MTDAKKINLVVHSIHMPLVYAPLNDSIAPNICKKMLKAREEEKKGKVDSAINIYNLCLKEYNCPELINDICIVLFSFQQQKNALKIMEERIKKYDRSPFMYYNYGTMLFLTGNYRLASAHLEQACSLDPSNQSFKNNFSLALLRCHDMKNALLINKAAQETINNDDIVLSGLHHNYALFEFHDGEIEKALEYAHKSLNIIHNGNALTWNNIGCFLYALNKSEEALLAFKKSSLLSNMTNDIALNNIGKIFVSNDINNDKDFITTNELTNQEINNKTIEA